MRTSRSSAVAFGGKAAAIVVITLVLGAATAADGSWNDLQNDTGLGTDASDVETSPTRLPGFGSDSANLALHDEDWYGLSTAASSPACLQVRAKSDVPADVRMPLATSAGTRTVTVRATDREAVGALAVPDHQGLKLGVKPVDSSTLSSIVSYGFALSLVTPPTLSQGDALSGRDAGGDASTAVPVKPGCFGGILAQARATADRVDLYALSVAAGDKVSYSLASHPGVTLRLLDASGAQVGPTILSGDSTGVTLGTAGTYYLAASPRTSESVDMPYVMGVVVGPPDPGHPCRPYC